MSELKKATSTWASTRSRHAVVRMESTAPFTFSTPESACTKGRPAVTRCLPGGNGGTGDLHVLGNGPGAATNAMFAKAMVVGAPSLRLGRDSGNHPRRFPCTSENRNDIEGAATANTKFRMSSFAAGLSAAASSPKVAISLPSSWCGQRAERGRKPARIRDRLHTTVTDQVPL
jgi:hypothetical protein